MSIPALDGTVECNDFCVLIFLILIEKKKKKLAPFLKKLKNNYRRGQLLSHFEAPFF